VSTTFFITKTSSTHYYQMSTSDQCALGPDGKLLDASEIVWVNDPDDPTSIEPIQQADVLASNSSTIHPFLRGGPPPATMVAGSRRSKRVSHPSKHVLDPDNSKRPDVSKRPRFSHQKKIVESDSDENDDNCVDEGNGDGAATNVEDVVIDTDVDSELVDTDFEAVEEAYAATKAMGDTDREVRLIFLHDF
jgi:hypothetical protein